MDIKIVDRDPESLEIGEGTRPIQGGRFRGTSIGRGELGYFCFLHRSTSKYYNSPADINDVDISFIRGTG